jgi:hypothetical protein
MTSRRLVAPPLLVAAASVACNGFVGEWTILDGFGKRFAGVETGHTRDQVVAVLGAQARESAAFRLPQIEGHEALLRKARESRASSFLYWDRCR